MFAPLLKRHLAVIEYDTGPLLPAHLILLGTSFRALKRDQEFVLISLISSRNHFLSQLILLGVRLNQTRTILSGISLFTDEIERMPWC